MKETSRYCVKKGSIMNTKALLKKIEKTDKIMYVKCDFVESLIGVTFDRCMVYWIDKKFVNPAVITILEPKIDFMNYIVISSIVKYILDGKLLSVHSDNKKKEMLLLDNRVLVNRKLLKYININKVWFYIEETENAWCKPVHIYEDDHLIATVYPIRFEKEQIQTWNEKADKIERIL